LWSDWCRCHLGTEWLCLGIERYDRRKARRWRRV
jgi:hypothetical protein